MCNSALQVAQRFGHCGLNLCENQPLQSEEEKTRVIVQSNDTVLAVPFYQKPQIVYTQGKDSDFTISGTR
jgi:hypothetical protein